MKIRAEGEFLFNDIYAGCRAMYRHSRFFWWLTGLAAFLLLVGLAAFALPGGFGQALPVFLVGLFWGGGYWIFPWFNARRVHRTRATTGKVEYEFDVTGWRWTHAQGQGELKWGALAKWYEGKETFLLFPNATAAELVPKRFFSSPEDVQAFHRLLADNIHARK